MNSLSGFAIRLVDDRRHVNRGNIHVIPRQRRVRARGRALDQSPNERIADSRYV